MDERRRIEELRALLLEIDHEILRAIERRTRVAQDLARLRPGTARFAPSADAAHLQALEGAATPPLAASAVRPIFTTIDAACRPFEVAPRVVFLGAEGDFGWIAARDHFGAGAELVRAEGPSAAIEEVARSRADFAVVPYESLKEGPIFPTIQAIAGADLKVVGERELAQALVLVSRSGNVAEVEKVYASPQDHVACVNYLEIHHPRALVLDVRSPQMAWELAAENHGSAAVVPRGFVGAHDLRVARENVGDEGEIRIRYAVLSRLPAPRSGNDATALLFSARDRPGALHDILQHFKERSCNLRRIHSRPIPGEGWEYVFYVEVSGHTTDRALVAALEGVKRETKMLKIIGSFPLERLDPAPEERA
ncbi:MAG: ACT domain-containing protein [Polyangiaceae bacterium]|nr:ACT domain-containing protein [Polyangiaceae bacterium]